MLKTISVSMLGSFSLSVDGRPLQQEAAKLTKPWQLFCYLVLHAGEIVPASQLLELMWDDDELADPANVLKNAIYALRREIAGKVKPGEGPILYRSGGYCLNPEIHFDVDVFTLEALCGEAEALACNSPQALAVCRSAVAAYTGDFLPMLDTELWVAPYVRRCKLAYVQAARRLCACLEESRAWNELLAVSARASLADPLDEACMLYTFRAMAQLQMPRAIVTTYGKTARFFEDETGRPLCAEIRRIYTAAAERVNKAEQDLMVIREDLQDATRETRPAKGPYYCSYEVFKSMYPILLRNAERAKQKQALLLLTVLDRRRRLPGPQLLLQAMSDLRLSINTSLRRSDTYARYSKNQYIVLVPLENPDNATVAEKRVAAVFAGTDSAAKTQLQCNYTAL